MSKGSFYRMVGLILLSASVYQIIATGVAAFFWIVAGEWRDLILQIMVIAFWITLPVTYILWQRMYARFNS